MFAMPQSRTEVLKAGIAMLQAQQRHYLTLSPQHYKLYALAFFTLEAAAAIMVVYIAFPNENEELFDKAILCIRESVERMRIIEETNPFAKSAAELIEKLLARAVDVHKDYSNPTPSHPTNTPPLSQQYNTDYKPSFNTQIDSSYTPTPVQAAVDLSQLSQSNSSSSLTPPEFDFNFDFTCGGLIGPYGPTAMLLDQNFMESDNWDPMILLDRGVVMGDGDDGDNGFGDAGYSDDIYH